ncbi:endonuclease/exonuclease/phosphatase family protein [Lacticaseibacillus daqingensis]|uniref:endonuclease/exonuclease/phosphatase family protein n=1 Tax=Lacticaseibacillus daqingensis TaxID=2486014 RepID=UPI000F785780|nr:endonuclease/exonuclease/phosphatase family protein [Lacticaseibacillus daqingensis]
MNIKVATFNLAAGEHPDCSAINRLCVESGIQILGAQELDRFSRRLPFDMPALVAGSKYRVAYAPVMPLMGGEYGIALLADQQLEAPSVYPYTVFGEEPRVFQHANYDNGRVRLSVYNTHLSFETMAIRQQQARELLTAIREDSAANIVVFGDFNMDQSHDEWQVFNKSLTRLNGGDGQWFNSFVGRDEAMKVYEIDNIMVSSNIRVVSRELVPTLLSDHRMFAAELEVPEY